MVIEGDGAAVGGDAEQQKLPNWLLGAMPSAATSTRSVVPVVRSWTKIAPFPMGTPGASASAGLLTKSDVASVGGEARGSTEAR